MQKKLFLLDAMALIFRAYYALMRSPRITSTGKNTNAQFGFTNTLLDLLQNQKPSHIAVCFDTEELTERHVSFSDYKANRQEAPEDLVLAIPDIKRIIEGFNIPVIEANGYEADDIIGTLAKRAAEDGFDVYMVTPDKDYGQLVSDRIHIYKPGTGGNAAEILGPDEVCAKWDIQSVDQVIEILGLMGDAVDNIPGVPGIGEKTAAKLIKEYGNIDNIIAHAHEIKGAIGEKMRNGKDLALMSRKLATIILDVPVDWNEEACRVQNPNKEKLLEVFTELEFRTLGKRILGEEINITPKSARGGQMDLFGGTTTVAKSNQPTTPTENQTPLLLKTIENTPHQYHLIEDEKAILQLVDKLLKHDEISFDTETTGIDAQHADLVGLSFSVTPGEGWYVPCPPNRNQTTSILQQLKPLFDNPHITWVGQNIKYDLLMLKWYGFEVVGNVFDTMIAHYVIEPDGKHNMDMMSQQYLGYTPISIETLIGKKGKNQGNMKDVDKNLVKEYAVEDADITLQLRRALEPEMLQKNVHRVFYEVDNPLIKVLMNMEYEGIKVDEAFLRAYSNVLDKEAKEAESRVYEAAGVKFNLASPKQLGEVLFEKLKLDPQAKKTKTGQYATGEDVLIKLSEQHSICKDILEFREITKLKSTYVDALPELIHPKTGRVHTSYGQAIAVTGRLSSNNPNLQNIPVRTDRGREIRKAFIARDEDYLLVSADYSQIELRIVAAISGDPNMIEAFKAHKDIHTATAAKVFGVEEDQVTKEMRYKAKSVNFGIIYGQGAFGLAENLKISRTEAKEIIDNYKKQFPLIQQYMDQTIAFCKQHGYVETLMGRKRWLKDITSNNFTVRGFAERNAINSPIQGTAADMIKLAMIRIHNRLKKEGLKTTMLLQVHDELIFDVPTNELDAASTLIKEEMEQAMILPNGVPVIAETGHGHNWLEAH